MVGPGRVRLMSMQGLVLPGARSEISRCSPRGERFDKTDPTRRVLAGPALAQW